MGDTLSGQNIKVLCTLNLFLTPNYTVIFFRPKLREIVRFPLNRNFGRNFVMIWKTRSFGSKKSRFRHPKFRQVKNHFFGETIRKGCYIAGNTFLCNFCKNKKTRNFGLKTRSFGENSRIRNFGLKFRNFRKNCLTDCFGCKNPKFLISVYELKIKIFGFHHIQHKMSERQNTIMA